MTLTETIERAKSEVIADVKDGIVPAYVASFADLHDYIDANGYGGAFEGTFDASDEAHAFWNAVQGAVDEWIKKGALLNLVPRFVTSDGYTVWKRWRHDLPTVWQTRGEDLTFDDCDGFPIDDTGVLLDGTLFE